MSGFVVSLYWPGLVFPALVMTTDVIRNVCNLPLDIVLPPRHHVGKVSLVQLHIYAKRRAESIDLHVVTVCTSSGHLLQVTLKRTLNLFWCGWETVGRSRISVCILPFWVASGAAAGVDGDVLFIVGGVLPHVFDHTSADLVVSGLSAV